MEPFYFHIQVIIFLFNLTLGYVVWTYNAKSNLNRILTLIIVCILLIDISLLFYLRMEGRRLLIATITLGSLGISFFAPFFYTLSLYYPVKRVVKRKYTITIYSVAFTLFYTKAPSGILPSLLPGYLLFSRTPHPRHKKFPPLLARENNPV